MMKVFVSLYFILLSLTDVSAFSSISRRTAFQTRSVPASDIFSKQKRSSLFAQTEEKNGVFSDEVQQEAQEVLTKVGWARPMEGEGEMTSDDPFVQQINAGIQRDFGVDLDDLLNPAKVGSLPC